MNQTDFIVTFLEHDKRQLNLKRIFKQDFRKNHSYSLEILNLFPEVIFLLHVIIEFKIGFLRFLNSYWLRLSVREKSEYCGMNIKKIWQFVI